MMKKLLILTLMSIFAFINESWAAAQPGDDPQKCGDTLEDCSFIVDSNNNVVISGTGAITGNWEGNKGSGLATVTLGLTMRSDRSVIIEEGIINIDGMAGVGVDSDSKSYGAVSVYVPESVTQIGPNAFQNSAIGNLVIAGEDTVIDPQALANIRDTIGSVGDGELTNYTTTITCVKGSKTEERLMALIGDNPRFSIGYIEGRVASGADSATSQSKARRTFYTPAEAAQHVNHTNNNKIIFTFK